jgi:hypothetical protein
MSGKHHERSAIAAFLDADFRQVWAVDRATGNPRFLPEGEAVALRPIAKAEWRCPVPDCGVQITTVGGSSRRHHFKHVGRSPHASDGESEFHLGAKAMLAEWARERVPEGALVREEHSVKHPATRQQRIADVMVTWPDGRLTAFEVEYKNYAPEDWATKQADYDAHDPAPVPCVWVFGHTKIKRPRAGSYDADDDPRNVRLPLLGQRWLAAGRPVLAVNPVTREVGTLLAQFSRDGHPRYPGATDTLGRLHVDPLDACALDPERGIVTPTMRLVDAAEERREELRRRAAEDARKRLEAECKRQEAAARKRQYYEELRQQQLEVWESSALHAVLQRRWPDMPHLLGLLSTDDLDQSGVWANPTHWRAVLYEELIHPFALGSGPALDDAMNSGALLSPRMDPRFDLGDIRAALAAHHIRLHEHDPYKSFNLVMTFMERLQSAHMLAITRHLDGTPKMFHPTGYTLQQAEAEYRAQLAARAARTEALQGAKDGRRVQLLARTGARATKPTFAERVDRAAALRQQRGAEPQAETTERIKSLYGID